MINSHIKPVAIVVMAQWLGTSLWFTASGVAAGLARNWVINETFLSPLTVAVQASFIVGTSLSAFFGLPDRVDASKLFAAAALLGAAANAGFALVATSVSSASGSVLMTLNRRRPWGVRRFSTEVSLKVILDAGCH